MKKIIMLYKDIVSFIGAKQSYETHNVALKIFREKFQLNEEDAIIILEAGVEEMSWHEDVTKFIQSQNIESAVFIVEDVFRLYQQTYHNDPYVTLEIFDERMADENYRSIELDLITEVVNAVKIKYRIFACERNPKVLSERHKLKIEYFDLFLHQWGIMQRYKKKINSDVDFIYKASCFNNRHEIHRQYISTLLFENKDVLLTFNESYRQTLSKTMGLELQKLDNDIRDQLEKNEIQFSKYRSTYLDGKLILNFNIPSREQQFNIATDHLKQDQTMKGTLAGFLNIPTETRMCTTMPYISEKTLKPIFSGRPFILLAPFESLKLVKEFGFETFDKWWDESYDNIEDHTLRFQAAYRSIMSVIERPMEELKNMYKEMLPVLNHNKERAKTAWYDYRNTPNC